MTDHLLEVRGLSVEFHTAAGTVKAVQNVSWHLDRGETLAILGESGSGKSVSASAVMNLIDMPPGTGDAQLTLAQNVPLKGAVIISTPQDLSLIDARRGLAMFKKVNVPVLGIVENMSYFQCPHCGTRSDIFGHGGARHEAEKLGVPFLGEIPLHIAIRTASDSGNPVVESEPDGPHAAIYRAIGGKVREQLQGVIAAA